MVDLRPHTIHAIVWDANGNADENIAVIFSYREQSETLYTADDGSVSFSLLNFDDVPNGAYINVSCKHGAKNVPVNYAQGATGVTYNEPSEDDAITAFAALGFIAVAAGGGIYYLTRRKKDEDE
jgi:LPXTG-motif cell wall-anchored protein